MLDGAQLTRHRQANTRGIMLRAWILDQSHSRLASTLDALEPREQEVIELRYGLASGRPRTLRETATVLGFIPSSVRKIEARALRRLHARMERWPFCRVGRPRGAIW